MDKTQEQLQLLILYYIIERNGLTSEQFANIQNDKPFYPMITQNEIHLLIMDLIEKDIIELAHGNPNLLYQPNQPKASEFAHQMALFYAKDISKEEKEKEIKELEYTKLRNEIRDYGLYKIIAILGLLLSICSVILSIVL